MKALTTFLITLAAPAVILLSLNQLGGTPLSKGYDTGFSATMENSRLALRTETGDLTCWVRLRLPAGVQYTSASLSSGTPLAVYQEMVHEGNQWIAIVAQGQKPEEKFKWPSGATLVVNASGDATPSDWKVFLSDQAFDSNERARLRKRTFRGSLVLLAFALLGAGITAYAKEKGETVTLTHERFLAELIKSTEGSGKETKWMQQILTKVLLQGIPVKDAISALPFKNINERRAIWFKARSQFRGRLQALIVSLNADLIKLKP
jgi:hypothetical protein